MQRLVWRIGDYMANTRCWRQMHVEACIQVIVFPNEDMGKEVLVSNQERLGGKFEKRASKFWGCEL
jgi:hypothetical protein